MSRALAVRFAGESLRGSDWISAASLDREMERFVADPVAPREFLERDFAVAHQDAVGELGVGHLLCLGGPSDVTRLVVAIDEDPIQRVSSSRTGTDVCKKSREVVAPFLAHSDSTGAIGIETLGSWVVATLFGSTPSVVFGGRGVVDAGAVSETSFADEFLGETPAAFGEFGSERFRSSGTDGSAIAATSPMRAATLILGPLYYDETAESLAGKIKETHSAAYHSASFFARKNA